MSGERRSRPPRDDLDQMGILTIEVPDAGLAQELVNELQDGWACCACDETGARAIVFLSPHNTADFSQLVHRVQEWLADHSVEAVAFQLRGRGHIHGTT